MTVRWWEKDNVAFANLVVGLAQINRRADRCDPVDELYRRLAYALMQFANGYSDARDFGPMGEARKVRTYLRDCGAWAFDDDFLDGEALRRLVAFRPMIASDDAVRETGASQTAGAYGRRTRRGARESTGTCLGCLTDDRLRCQQHRQEIGWCLGDLLYVVRCNLDHSEKTPFGPDVTKAKRDFAVCL